MGLTVNLDFLEMKIKHTHLVKDTLFFLMAEYNSLGHSSSAFKMYTEQFLAHLLICSPISGCHLTTQTVHQIIIALGELLNDP